MVKDKQIIRLNEIQKARLREWGAVLGLTIREVPDLRAIASTSVRQLVEKHAHFDRLLSKEDGNLYIFSQNIAPSDNYNYIDYMMLKFALENRSVESILGERFNDFCVRLWEGADQEQRNTVASRLSEAGSESVSPVIGGRGLLDEYTLFGRHGETSYREASVEWVLHEMLDYMPLDIDHSIVASDPKKSLVKTLSDNVSRSMCAALDGKTDEELDAHYQAVRARVKRNGKAYGEYVVFGQMSDEHRSAGMLPSAMITPMDNLIEHENSHLFSPEEQKNLHLVQNTRHPLATFISWSTDQSRPKATDKRFLHVADIKCPDREMVDKTFHRMYSGRELPAFYTNLCVITSSNEEIKRTGRSSVLSFHPRNYADIVRFLSSLDDTPTLPTLSEQGQRRVRAEVRYLSDDFESHFLEPLKENLEAQRRFLESIPERQRNINTVNVFAAVPPESVDDKLRSIRKVVDYYHRIKRSQADNIQLNAETEPFGVAEGFSVDISEGFQPIPDIPGKPSVAYDENMGLHFLDEFGRDIYNGLAFSSLSEFSNDYAVATIDAKGLKRSILIDSKLQPLDRVFRRETQAMSKDGWALIKTNAGERCPDKYNYINRNGQMMSTKGFTIGTDFKDGKATVIIGRQSVDINTLGIATTTRDIDIQAIDYKIRPGQHI